MMNRINKIFRRNKSSYVQGLPAESVITGSRDRYTDPLIEYKYHEVTSPGDREEVSASDPIAHILTWGFGQRAWSKYPKFYASDELRDEEIGQNTRQMLKMFNIHEPGTVAWAVAFIHGWSVTIFNTDENGELDYFIFSEKECRSENFIRDPQTNRVIGWHVYLRTRLPFNRPIRQTYNTTHRTYMRDDPGVVYLTIGDEKRSWGFGYSDLEPTWDSITKLREESHSNHFRTRVFPLSVVPGNWKKPQIEEYMKNVAKMDMMNALTVKSGKDSQGNLVPELPAFNWISPGTSASSKSSSGGGGVFSDLSSEWVRLCGQTHHSIRYFTGNPGGALAAAEVDQEQDSIADIEKWNMAREWLTKVIEFLIESGAESDLPEGFVVKSHWEWERDEMLNQQSMMAELELSNTQETHDKEMSEPTETPKENEAIENGLLSKLRDMITGTKKPEEEEYQTDIQAIMDLPNFQADQKSDINKWMPVNSASGNMDSVMLDMGDEDTAPTIYGSFGGGNIYAVQDPDELQNPLQTFKNIQQKGGDAWWEEIRASKAERSGKEDGKHPKGSAKTGGGKFAYAGKAHMTDYVKVARGRTPVKMANKERKREIAQKTKSKSRSKSTKGKGMIGQLLSKTKSFVKANDVRHPILQKYNSINKAAKALHHSKSTIYKMMETPNMDAVRLNMMHSGNSFSTKNPFKYLDPNSPSGISVEYQCPDEIKKIIGSRAPIVIDHDGQYRPEEDTIGSYEITGFDDKLGIETANYDIDWELVDDWFKKNAKENWVEQYRSSGKLPDTSTEYMCNVHYDRERGIFIQKDFNLTRVALVPEGNCSTGFCGINNT